MTYKISKDKEIDILMEEYKQVYESSRQFDNIASNKEAIFAVASFGILALVLERGVISFYPALGAAVVSMTLYLYHHFAFNRVIFFKKVTYVRLREIEDRINELSGLNKDILRFQMNYDPKYKNKAKKKDRVGSTIKIINMHRLMVFLLFILWLAVFIWFVEYNS